MLARNQAMKRDEAFLCGVIEGFYGRPWTVGQRRELLERMARWGLNTYFYAPKDDLYHRTRWRDRYPAEAAGELGALIRETHRRGIAFLYAVGPGLDIRHASRADERALWAKVDQVARLGCRHFALLFDDIPAALSAVDRRRFGTVAAAQGHVANRLSDFLEERVPGGRFLFCPTAYCGRMCQPSVTGSAYLRELGERLKPRVEVLWTGPEIISEEIPVASVRELRRVIGRKPVIWDNLQANDYDLRRMYLGPYVGRAAALREEVGGVLTNPNCEYEANFVAIRTLALWVAEGRRYDPARAYRRALREWVPDWRARSPHRFGLADLEVLADCLHLPHQQGAWGEALLAGFRGVVGRGAEVGNRSRVCRRFVGLCRRVERMFERLTAVEDRDLVYAVYRHAWELKEELMLLRRYAEWRAGGGRPRAGFVSPEHRPGIYRGGLVAGLQRMLPMDAAGRFHAVEAEGELR